MKQMMFALLCLSLTGCMTPTPYGPRGYYGGYKDEMLSKDKYLVSFLGNKFTSPETTKEYSLKRARELCIEKNMDFDIQPLGSKATGVNTSCMRNVLGVVQCNSSQDTTEEVIVQCKPKT